MSIKAEFEGIDSQENEKEIVRTVYRCERRGHISFKYVPADASKRMPDDIMDSVEPFRFEELKPFSMSYLPGFLAEKFDVEGDDDLERAEKRVVNTAKQKTRATVKHEDIKELTGQYQVNYTDKKYAMLPVWYLTTAWNGRQWNFAMNGQTGAFTGDLPVDYTKLGIITALSAIVPGVLLWLATKSIPLAVIAALIIALIVFYACRSSMKPVHHATQANEYMDKDVRMVVSHDQFVRTEREIKAQRPTQSADK